LSFGSLSPTSGASGSLGQFRSFRLILDQVQHFSSVGSGSTFGISGSPPVGSTSPISGSLISGR